LIYDKDFNFVGNVLDADAGYARVTVISGDGMTYYDCSYTMPGIMIYTRASEFDPFTLTDSLYGFKTESAVWDPLEANVLWASSGNVGYSDPGLFNGTYQLTDGNWYKIDIATKTLKDSVEWHFYGDRAQSGAGEKQRSIAFSADGKTCYLGAFGTAGLYPLIEKFTKGSTGVEQDKTEKPSKFNLAQNYPNPFNPTTKINFSVVENGLVTLKVYNMLGQEVATLVNETLNAGVYNVDFDASQLTSGTYLYEITAGNFSSSKKMLLVK
ncbi:MAG: T9SS C-terminal target domain-containing protein, partial [Ignavibacteriales bacterium]